MSQDPLDKQLVEAVLAGRPRRTRIEIEEAKLASKRPTRPGVTAVVDPIEIDDEDDDDDDTDLGLGDPEALTEPADASVDVAVEGDSRGPRAARRRPRQARRQGARGADRRGARGALGRHDRDRRPGPDVPQGDRQGRPADRRGRGRPGQGHRARRADRRGALEGDRLAPRVDRSTTPSARRGRPSRSTACRSATRPTRSSATRSRTGAPGRCSTPTPDFHLIKAGRDAQSDGTKERLKEAKQLVAAYNEKPDAGDVPAAARLGVPRRPQRRPRLARQRRAAGDLRLDPRRGRVPGARALDPGRQRRGPAQADGLRPRGAARRPSCATARASSSGSAATRASS